MNEDQERLVIVLDKQLKRDIKDLAWRRRLTLSDYVRAILAGVAAAEKDKRGGK